MPSKPFTYPAPWSTVLRLVSLCTTILLLVIASFIWRTTPLWGPVTAVIAITVLFGSALFTIRGYRLDQQSNTLVIHRLFWSTKLSLAGLESATADPDALNGSIRLWGNGGLYSFSGLFRSKCLGTYRCFVTDHKNAIILRFHTGKPVVVSPANPHAFAHDLQLLKPQR